MIILSIPYRSKNSLFAGNTKACDWVEYRLDYCKHIAKLNLSQFNSDTILTYRDIAEGGKNPLSDDIKLKLIQDIKTKTNALIQQVSNNDFRAMKWSEIYRLIRENVKY